MSPTSRETCPECGGELKEHISRGETYCKLCGFIVVRSILDRAPPRTEEIPPKGIPFNPRDSGGAHLDVVKVRRLSRTDRYNKPEDRKEQKIWMEISKVVSQLQLPKGVTTMALEFFLKAPSVAGAKIKYRVCGAIYASARMQNIFLEVSDLAKVFFGETTEHGKKHTTLIFKAYKRLCRKLELRPPMKTPEYYLPFLLSQFESLLGETGRKKSYQYVRLYKGNKTNPAALAVAVVYMAILHSSKNVALSLLCKDGLVSSLTARSYIIFLMEYIDEPWATVTSRSVDDIVKNGTLEERTFVWKQKLSSEESVFVCSRAELHLSKKEAMSCNLTRYKEEEVSTVLKIDIEKVSDEIITPVS